jgi:hypothetical protein
LKELIKEINNEGSGNELEDEEKADSHAEVRRLAIESGEAIGSGWTEECDERKKCQL